MILSYADAKLHKVTRKSSGKYESTKVEQIFLGELRCRMCQKRDKLTRANTLEHKKMNILTIFSSSSTSFFTSLTRTDASLIKSAQTIFLSQSVINLFLYYLGYGIDGNNTKFPATISFTIRAGLPFYSNLILWSSGWIQMFRVLLSKGDKVAKIFAAQMYLVGLSTVYFFPVGISEKKDQIHGSFAGLYFVYHIVLFKYLRTTFQYQMGFYVSFLSFVLFLKKIRAVEQQYDFKTESNNTLKSKTQKKKLSKDISNSLFMYELGLMVTENSMFISFLLGMTSSLKHLLK